jgi:hypothetical protein
MSGILKNVHKIKTQKTVPSPYNNELTEKEIRKAIPFTIA